MSCLPLAHAQVQEDLALMLPNDGGEYILAAREPKPSACLTSPDIHLLTDPLTIARCRRPGRRCVLCGRVECAREVGEISPCPARPRTHLPARVQGSEQILRQFHGRSRQGVAELARLAGWDIPSHSKIYALHLHKNTKHT